MGALVGMIFLFIVGCATFPVFTFIDWYCSYRKKGQSYKDYLRKF